MKIIFNVDVDGNLKSNYFLSMCVCFLEPYGVTREKKIYKINPEPIPFLILLHQAAHHLYDQIISNKQNGNKISGFSKRKICAKENISSEYPAEI